MALKKFLVVLAFVGFVQAASVSQDERIRYDNYSVFKIRYETQEQSSHLRSLLEDRDNFKHWGAAKDELHLLVSPGALSQFKTELQRANLTAEVLVSNVQDLIDSEKETDSRASADGSFGWRKYNTLAEIYAWLDGILTAYPSVTEEFIVGQSYEGRTIRGIKISYKSGNPGVLIESNIHAPEWITSATATWMINEFLTSQDVLVRQMVENHDWYIIPVLNVDGFVHSHEKDRMWRKTRQPSADSSCIGVDPNRNFDVHWMENEGASSDPCAWNYGGPHALSEPEVQAMTDLIKSLKDRVNVMLAFHSCSQLVLSPYGHSSVEVPPNYDDLMTVAKAYVDAVNKLPYGSVFQYGSMAEQLYPATGASIDFSYQEGIEIAYIIEFRDTGNYCFVLPPAHIIPNSEEALEGIMALLEKTEELGYMNSKSKV